MTLIHDTYAADEALFLQLLERKNTFFYTLDITVFKEKGSNYKVLININIDELWVHFYSMNEYAIWSETQNTLSRWLPITFIHLITATTNTKQ